MVCFIRLSYLRLKFFVSKGVFIHKITSEGCQTIREGRARVWEPENLAMVEGPFKKKSKLPDFGRFKSGPRKKVAENRCSPFWRVWFFFRKKKQSEEEAQSRNKRGESFFGLFWSRVLPPKQSHFLHLHKRSEFSLSLFTLSTLWIRVLSLLSESRWNLLLSARVVLV